MLVPNRPVNYLVEQIENVTGITEFLHNSTGHEGVMPIKIKFDKELRR